MSLCSLICNNKQEISSANDRIHIMNIGNHSYSSLSLLARQSYNADRITYNFKHAWHWQRTRTQWKLQWNCKWWDPNRGISVLYLFTKSPQITIISKLHNFILSVGCIGVSIYFYDDMRFKILDSHARDVYTLKVHVCFLKHYHFITQCSYFQSLHNDDVLKRRGFTFI